MKINVQKFSKTVNPFSGISFVNNAFDQIGVNQLIDSELGDRVQLFGYQYSDIIRNLANVFLCGGDCIEDISGNLGNHLKSIPNNNVPSPDTVSRGIRELSTENTAYTSDSGKSYNFNTNKKLNLLNIKLLKLTRQLTESEDYDFDYDNQIVANKKYDAEKTYKKNKGYFPGIATIGDKVVYIENRDGNANVKFKQAETLKRAYGLLSSEGININRSRMDAGSYSKEIIDVVDKNSKLFYIRANKSENLFEKIKEVTNWQNVEINYKEYEVASIKFTQFYKERNYRLVIMREKTDGMQFDLFTGDNFKYRTILTNDLESTEQEVIEYYNQRGSSEKIFDVMNNDFGWKHLPASFLNENGAFMIITAMIKNFYNYFVKIVSSVFEGINHTTRLKRFVFRFITVAGKWVYQSRQWILKLFTDQPYEKLIFN
ncbi:MAG: IS1380 family transposase [Pseudomonadota bacterium]|nr:IS1380 family transposase [Pseudomonadota bacterium]